MGETRDVRGRCREALAWMGISFGLALLLPAAVGTAAAAAAPFEAHGSAEQVYATGLQPGAEVTLLDGEGGEVATQTANGLGGALFRDVAPGNGYRVGSGLADERPDEVHDVPRDASSRENGGANLDWGASEGIHWEGG